MDLKGEVALVTGSSSGIGEAAAKGLANEGVRVIVNARKNTKGGKRVVSDIKNTGGDAIFIQADCSNPDEVQRLFKESLKAYGEISILINNAGQSKGGTFGDLKLWKYQFENILLSQVIVSNEFLKRSSGNLRKIINVSSIYGSSLGGHDNFMAYSAAKAGVNNLTINMAKKFGPSVLVNAIAPGYTWTPPWGSDRSLEEREINKYVKIKRFIEPSEVAQMIVTTLKNDAITGQIITIDGGATLKDLY